jgi:hypothetical protein
LPITSLTFMFDRVPDPVCQTNSGNSESSLPAITSSAAATIACARSESSRPAASFTNAAAFFTYP